MSTKTTTAKKKSTTSKASSHKGKSKSAKPKASWAETMKQALEKKQSGGYPQQPKPRDSTVQPVRKNAY